EKFEATLQKVSKDRAMKGFEELDRLVAVYSKVARDEQDEVRVEGGVIPVINYHYFDRGFKSDYLQIGHFIILSDYLNNPSIQSELRRLKELHPDLITIFVPGPILYSAFLAALLSIVSLHDFKDKVVEDDGVGNGVLSLASLQMGAKQVIGVDRDLQLL